MKQFIVLVLDEAEFQKHFSNAMDMWPLAQKIEAESVEEVRETIDAIIADKKKAK